jgi:hypothetical protein
MTLLAVGLAVAAVFVLSSRDRSPGSSRTPDQTSASESATRASGPGQALRLPGDTGADAADSAASRAATSPAAGDVDGQSSATEDPSRVPIAVPADFVEVFERSEDLAAFHAALESEPEDSAWALGVEQYLESHFNGTLDLSEWRVQLIECRSMSCEILATGYGEDSMRGWMQSVAQLFEDEEQFKALMRGTGMGSCGGSDLAPGVFAVNCTIRRTDEEPPSSTEAEVFPIDTPYPDEVSVDPLSVADIVTPAIESDRVVFDLHRRLEQESVDYAWAGYVEPLINDFLGGLDPERGLGLLDVTCRSTLCEVQMVARDEDVAMVEWVTTMLDFLRTDGHDLVPAGGNEATIDDGGQIGIVWFLERLPGE